MQQEKADVLFPGIYDPTAFETGAGAAGAEEVEETE